ncbi:zincin-like metallopeptidase domain-containing protein [Tenacibaculum maritimum]|uniref:zincin-like metallopeptidase domain-containing protein n=1 Tax=Tenacibaculum maritimum TaxID=107401 RepID=UPI00387756E1
MLQSLIEQYNSLDNTKRTRAYLEAFLTKLEMLKNATKETRVMYNNIQNTLKQFSDQEFLIELSTKMESNSLLISEGMGIPLLARPVKNQDLGLNGKISSDDIYQMITDKMINLIEEATGHGYQKKWQERQGDFMYPINFISKKPYRGINHMLLSTFGMKSFDNPYFLTFKQIQRLGGIIKPGTKSKEVIYFTKLYVFTQNQNSLKIGTYDVKKFVSYILKHKNKIEHFKKGESLESFINKSTVPLLRYYRVYNGSDVEGVDFKLDEYRKQYLKSKKQKIISAEEIINAYPSPKPPLRNGGNSAYYSPSKDFVQIPKLNDFDTEEDYYKTLFHELIHSTGHKKRLNRLIPGSIFGDEDYAKEELVAEFGAVFLSAEAGIMWRNNSNHAEYIKGWKRALKHLKNDNKLLLKASSLAQKATDYILQRDENEIPKYLEAFTQKTIHKKTVVNKKRKVRKEAIGMKGVDKEITLNIPKVEEIQIDLPVKKEIQILEPPIAPTKTVATINKNINFVEPEKQSILQGNQPFQHKKTIVETKQKQKTPLLQQNKNPFKTSYELLNQEEKPTEYFKLHNQHLTTFLGKIEKKEKGSVVITLDSEEGGGKTHTAYQFANAFAEAGYKGVIFSFEEGANNSLSKVKQKKYFNEYTQQLISVAEDNSEFSKEQNYKMITDNIGYFDFIVVDSWAKILELNRKASLDNDFRKKYNGKVFLIINQRTKDGKMRGGANVAYDGDIVLKGVVDREDFKNNYIYNHKNRYNDYNPISELKYSPYYQKLMTQEKEIVVNI